MGILLDSRGSSTDIISDDQLLDAAQGIFAGCSGPLRMFHDHNVGFQCIQYTLVHYHAGTGVILVVMTMMIVLLLLLLLLIGNNDFGDRTHALW